VFQLIRDIWFDVRHGRFLVCRSKEGLSLIIIFL
jgi:hypothetical protein